MGVVVLAGAVVLWEEGLEHRVVAKNLGVVEPGLYRSGQFSRFMIGPALRQTRPDLIVSLSYDKPTNPHNMAEFAAARDGGIERVHVNLRGDGTGKPKEYVEALVHIVNARRDDKVVLVHCWAGSERTGGLTALYRTLIKGQPADETIVQELDAYGHDLDEGVLLDYLNNNVGVIAQGLVNAGVIDELPDPLPVFSR